MTTIFEKAPLVEIIAELRWGNPPQLASQPEGVQVPFQLRAFNLNKLEEFFMRFGGIIYQSGFDRAERLVPPNFESQSPNLYIDTGKAPRSIPLCCINSARSFFLHMQSHLIVRGTISLPLLNRASRPSCKREMSWSGHCPLSRSAYVTSTRSSLNSPVAAISAILLERFRDFNVELPQVISKQIEAGKSVKPALQFVVPLSNGMVMTLGVQEGIVSNEPATIMDITIANGTEVPADADKLMGALNAARTIIHDVFFEVTKPIHALMKPTSA